MLSVCQRERQIQKSLWSSSLSFPHFSKGIVENVSKSSQREIRWWAQLKAIYYEIIRVVAVSASLTFAAPEIKVRMRKISKFLFARSFLFWCRRFASIETDSSIECDMNVLNMMAFRVFPAVCRRILLPTSLGQFLFQLFLFLCCSM